MPADVNIAHDAVWLTRRINSVRIEVNPRLDGVETLSDATGRRIVEPQRLRPLGADRISVFELHQHSVRFKSGRLKLRRIQQELTRYEIDAAEHALIGGLSARDHYVAHASVVTADRPSDDLEVKRRVVENDVVASIGPYVRNIVRERAGEIPTFNVRAVVSGQRPVADIRASRHRVHYVVGPGCVRPVDTRRNTPEIDTVLRQVNAVDVAGGRNHVAWLQESADWSRGVYERPWHILAITDLGGFWRDNGERGVRAGTACGHSPHDNRFPGYVLNVALGIGELDADRRLRVVIQRHLVGEELRDQVGEKRAVPSSCAVFAPVVPAVAIHILVRIVNMCIYVGERESVLPPAFHEVMVCDNLAVVLIRLDVATAVVKRLGRTEIVVRHTLVGLRRVGVQRAYERPAVRNAIRIRTEADEVFRVVRETVLVGVVVGTISGDAKQVLPPVGDIVGVCVNCRGIFAMVLAVRLHAKREVDGVGDVRGQLSAVPVDYRIPVVAARRVEAILILPPVGKPVSIRVDRCVFPGVGDAVAVPHRRAGLRVRAAHRDEIGRAYEVGADLVLVAANEIFEQDVLRVGLGEQVEFEETLIALEEVVMVRIRHRRVVERVLGELVQLCGSDVATEIVGVDERVNDAAVHDREVVDGVLDPRHDGVVGVDRALRRAGVPPADVLAEGGWLADELPADSRVEAHRVNRDVCGVDCARERRKVVELDELGREPELAVVVVARRVGVRAHKVRVDLFAVRRGVCLRHLFRVVRGNLARSAHAVPDADLVDIALEPLVAVHGVVGDGGRVERRRAAIAGRERPAADEERAGHRLVGKLREGVRVRRVLDDDGDAVGRDQRRRLAAALDAVHIEEKRLAVVGHCNVGPLVEGHLGTVDSLAADGVVVAGIPSVIVVEHAVDPAVSRKPEAEVRADRGFVLVDGVVAVERAAVENRLGRLLLGTDPRLDGELLEEVYRRRARLLAREDVAHEHGAGLDPRPVAVEIERLTARRIGEVERVASRAGRRYDLVAVALPVVVGVVALVLLERIEEAEAAVAAVRRLGRIGIIVEADQNRPERHAGDWRGVLIVLGRIAGGRARVGVPERRRVGVSRHRARQVRRDAFGVVLETVAVGVGLAHAHRPRIAERIEGRGGLERRRIGDAARHARERGDAVEVGMGPLVPERVVEGGLAPGKGNYVLDPCLGRTE